MPAGQADLPAGQRVTVVGGLERPARLSKFTLGAMERASWGDTLLRGGTRS